MHSKIFSISLTALFSVIIMLCSWLSLPFAVPLTLQTFAVFLSLNLLGGKRGIQVIALYILCGAIGLPVYHSFTGGIGVLFGPTGGFITGFLIMGATYLAVTKKAGNALKIKTLALLSGLTLCYLFGSLQFAYFSQINLADSFKISVLPFILPDLLKLFLSLIICKRLEKTKYFMKI